MKPGSARWWRELGLPMDARQAVWPWPGHAAAEAMGPAVLPVAPSEATPPAAAPVAARAAPPPAARMRAPEIPAAPAAAAPVAPAASAVANGAAASLAASDWPGLVAAIQGCTACALHQGRRQPVPGIGVAGAPWVFVGEGPGAEEDARGEPFVGASGHLLDAMLAALGLQRGVDTSILNVVKCRPPGNRVPDAGEVSACVPYLQRQIDLLGPRVIVALGKTAAQALLGSTVNLGSLRGQVHTVGGRPLIVTYHPAYLLRNPAEKGRAWADLCLARRALAEPAGPVQPGAAQL